MKVASKTYHRLSDSELVRLLQQDDHAAFEELYRRYVVAITNTAYKRLGDTERVKEIVQDVFVSFFENRHQLEAASNIGGYLYTATRNKIFTAFRDNCIHESHHRVIYLQSPQNTVTNQDEVLQAKEMYEHLQKKLTELPHRCQEAFRLSRVQNLSHKEIATKMNISESTVDKHISKAMQLLRASVKGFEVSIIILMLLCF
ncbi:MAG TPA: RNA polymerase sigma-70 factor [Chitinophagaceae bacterium]|nr:RNA polymerase sigma-70 factor [Chitinophagaceae bacterium]